MTSTLRLRSSWRSWPLGGKRKLRDALVSAVARRSFAPAAFARYRTDPAGYAREVLGVDWWSAQAEIARALLVHKRVFVKASHSVGKSFLAGGLVNWFYDCFDPGICVTTAPNSSQVVDILWKEVRVQRRGRPGLLPKAPRMESAPDHFAVGLTARDDAGFQGRHEQRVLVVFDECVGVGREFWEAAEGMLTGPECYWLAICNPTDASSPAFVEEQSGRWHVVNISALDHPNVTAELEGLSVPFPKAVRLPWVEGRLRQWCEPIGVDDARGGDVEFPPSSGVWYRPGPLFESRVLGRWPSQATDAVWGDGDWQAALRPLVLDPGDVLCIGCDVARFGDDETSIAVRRGPCVLHLEAHNGWSTSQTAGRLKELARAYAGPGEYPQLVGVHIDDDGVGGGVVDQAEGWNFVPVSGASRAFEADGYPNRRGEVWFATVGRAREGRLDLSRLSEDAVARLRVQLMAPVWRLDAQGRRVVEAKADTKKRIGRSPDDADALNLAFAPVPLLGSDEAAHARFWGPS